MKVVKHPTSLIASFIWVGFVCAISFMEAWLKFRAEGVTLAIGLSIGRIVFFALNKVELVLAVVILFDMLKPKKTILHRKQVYFAVSFFLLILQSLWLLPILDQRAELIITGKSISSSYYHLIYISMEIIKVICLCIFGLSLIKNRNDE